MLELVVVRPLVTPRPRSPLGRYVSLVVLRSRRLVAVAEREDTDALSLTARVRLLTAPPSMVLLLSEAAATRPLSRVRVLSVVLSLTTRLRVNESPPLSSPAERSALSVPPVLVLVVRVRNEGSTSTRLSGWRDS